MAVPKAPPRQVPDDASTETLTPSKPRVVRPKPVVARSSASGERAPAPQALEEAAERQVVHAPESPVLPIGLAHDRLGVPHPHPQQVSPLIQASLNARSVYKKASRQSRPKTFTVLSSSSGQVERDRPRLLTGQDVPLVAPTKRRSQRMLHAAGEDSRLPGTIAPTPSYGTCERGILPAWLREQHEEGNVAYAPPEPGALSSMYDAVDQRAEHEMNRSERAAASINRNTPFFPPHERDVERLANADKESIGPEHYRELNARTKQDTPEDRQMRLSTSRSRSLLTSGAPRRRLEHSQSQVWEAGTYAGFKSMPSSRDLRMFMPPRRDVSQKRSFQHARPVGPRAADFQPVLAPPPQPPADPTDKALPDVAPPDPSDSGVGDSVPDTPPEGAHVDWTVRPMPMFMPTRMPEMQRFTLLEDATRPQLTHMHERKPSVPHGVLAPFGAQAPAKGGVRSSLQGTASEAPEMRRRKSGRREMRDADSAAVSKEAPAHEGGADDAAGSVGTRPVRPVAPGEVPERPLEPEPSRLQVGSADAGKAANPSSVADADKTADASRTADAGKTADASSVADADKTADASSTADAGTPTASADKLPAAEATPSTTDASAPPEKSSHPGDKPQSSKEAEPQRTGHDTSAPQTDPLTPTPTSISADASAQQPG